MADGTRGGGGGGGGGGGVGRANDGNKKSKKGAAAVAAVANRFVCELVLKKLGIDAVVMSTRPCPEGVEVLAMAPESLQHIERIGSTPAAFTAPIPTTTATRPGQSLVIVLDRSGSMHGPQLDGAKDAIAALNCRESMGDY